MVAARPARWARGPSPTTTSFLPAAYRRHPQIISPECGGGDPIAVTAGGAGGTAPGALSTGPDYGPHLSLRRPLGGGRRHENLLRLKVLSSTASRTPGFGEKPARWWCHRFRSDPLLMLCWIDTHRRRSVGGGGWVRGGIMLGLPSPLVGVVGGHAPFRLLENGGRSRRGPHRRVVVPGGREISA